MHDRNKTDRQSHTHGWNGKVLFIYCIKVSGPDSISLVQSTSELEQAVSHDGVYNIVIVSLRGDPPPHTLLNVSAV